MRHSGQVAGRTAPHHSVEASQYREHEVPSNAGSEATSRGRGLRNVMLVRYGRASRWAETPYRRVERGKMFPLAVLMGVSCRESVASRCRQRPPKFAFYSVVRPMQRRWRLQLQHPRRDPARLPTLQQELQSSRPHRLQPRSRCLCTGVPVRTSRDHCCQGQHSHLEAKVLAFGRPSVVRVCGDARLTARSHVASPPGVNRRRTGGCGRRTNRTYPINPSAPLVCSSSWRRSGRSSPGAPIAGQ